MCKKQGVDDSSEAVREFLDSDDDTSPSEYVNKKVLTEEKSNGIEGEITLDELQYELFTKMKGLSAPGIDGFTVIWLRKFWSSLKLLTLNATKESYIYGTITTNLKTSIMHLLRKGQKIQH